MPLEEANYHPTPKHLIELIFRELHLKKGGIFYDLGCGDGRIVGEASKRRAKAIGVEIDPDLVKVCMKEVPNNAKIIQDNIFSVCLDDADSIFMFLDTTITNEMGYKIMKECKAGTRIASLVYPMYDFSPIKKVYIPYIDDRFEREFLYVYKAPLKFLNR